MSNKIDEEKLEKEPLESEVVEEKNPAEITENPAKPENFGTKLLNGFLKVCKTVWRWIARMFMGGSKELTDKEKFNVENIESPTKQTVKAFFRNKLAVGALVLIVSIFGLCFIGSAFLPIDYSYSENMLKNLSPSMGHKWVPGNISSDVKEIASFGFFSVGVGNDGQIGVWGNGKIPISVNNANMTDIPSEIKNAKVAHVSAGYDHAIAITSEGKVLGWGEYDKGEYGDKGSLNDSLTQVIQQPDELLNGTIDPNEVKQLISGYQVSALVMKSGKTYVWGNYKSGASNMSPLRTKTNVEKVVFTGTSAGALLKDGTIWLGTAKSSYGTYEYLDENGVHQFVNLIDDNYFQNKGLKVVDIAATNASMAFLADNGELIVCGETYSSSSSYKAQDKLLEGEIITEVHGGARHYVVRTNKNRVFGFGMNNFGQCGETITINDTDKIYVGAFQTYIADSNGKIYKSYGFQGFIFGSDEFGRDVLQRIINGGRMTLTIGAVAVIISSIIGIIIGVLSGYFGGIVDMLLMRITEIFSAIPFLPFALILSAILAGSKVTELQRIFLIMVILGILSWTGLAHMVRGQVLAEREKDFVLAAKAMGVKERRIAFKHILPNVISIILVSLTLDFAGCLLTESGLSYLGFGVQLPKPTWGNMLNGANNEIVIGSYWWRWVFPALFLLLSVISINIIGDTLRDILDPKSSKER